MIEVKTVPVTPFAQNARVIICQKTRHAAIVDPGGDIDKLKHVIEKSNCEPVMVLLTHGHLDHVGGAQEIAKHYSLDIVGPHIDDKFWFDALPRQSEMFNFPMTQAFLPTKWLTPGENVSIGEIHLEVRLAPGHSPGHIVFVSHQTKQAFVGDVIFNGSIGRTDFPGGSSGQLKASIASEIYSLGDEFVLYTGHGPDTTVGHERASNPFTQGVSS